MVFGRIFPRKHFPDGRPMSAAEESEHWIVQCSTCGWETTVAALGGVRYRARGTKHQWSRCPQCEQRRRLTITWHPPA